MEQKDLIYDWNRHQGTAYLRPLQTLELDDETLRDGLQSPSVTMPPVSERIRILHLIDSLGIQGADIGLPGAGGKVKKETMRLAQEIVRSKLKIEPNCAGRTMEVDVVPIVEIQQAVGIPVEASLFIGSSPIRRFAENWTLDQMLEHTRKSISFATREGVPVMYVTEDTTRADPEDLKKLYLTAIECGARRICLADTVGHANPNGVFQLITWIRKLLRDQKIKDVKVDFHGHQDRGLGVWNAITAFMAGADRVHGTALGIGERVGNAPMDQILINLKMLGWIDNDLSKLDQYCHVVSEAVEVPIPSNYPVIGSDAFETATGVHASAVIKALRKEDRWLADRVYSSVPASWVGRTQSIRIGPMSGRSNVSFWLEKNGFEPTETLVAKILNMAKKSNKLLEDAEIRKVIKGGANGGKKKNGRRKPRAKTKARARAR